MKDKLRNTTYKRTISMLENHVQRTNIRSLRRDGGKALTTLPTSANCFIQTQYMQAQL